MTELTKWLQNTITGIETVVDDKSFVCDEIVFKIDVVKNVLTAFKVALASLEAEPVASCIIEDGGMCVDGFGEYVGHSLPDGSHDLYTAPPAPVVPEGLVKAVRFYEQVKCENPPAETGAWKDAVDWVLKEACQAVNIGIKGE
ncbi:hypothetical protein LZ617_06510 [Escherichia coli]|uniref:hypothetical protein n=1 Tax=Escherichia coli TaxID=562 RepID=UPI001F3F89C6|nr:hypothetical protein [Escherichia coli]MCE9972643.1 hypothetical protein [Escherichia coli]MCE9989012.1 hypothetical protein [Escherichia coli]